MNDRRHSGKIPARLVPVLTAVIFFVALTGIVRAENNRRSAATEFEELQPYLQEVHDGGESRGDIAGYYENESIEDSGNNIKNENGENMAGSGESENDGKIVGSRGETKSPDSADESENSEQGDLPHERSWKGADLQADCDALRHINPDFVCVLDIPALELNYPVVAGRDNEEYLHLTFERRENPCGCLFLDSNADSRLRDPHTFLFGHNMRDGSMFGSLKRFYEEPELVTKEPYFYLVGEEGTFVYRIFAFGPVGVDDEKVYSYISTDEEYRDFCHNLCGSAWYYDRDKEVDTALERHRSIVTLSTCYGTDHVQNFAVHGVQVGGNR